MSERMAPTYRRKASGWWINGADAALAPHEGLLWTCGSRPPQPLTGHALHVSICTHLPLRRPPPPSAPSCC